MATLPDATHATIAIYAADGKYKAPILGSFEMFGETLYIHPTLEAGAGFDESDTFSVSHACGLAISKGEVTPQMAVAKARRVLKSKGRTAFLQAIAQAGEIIKRDCDNP